MIAELHEKDREVALRALPDWIYAPDRKALYRRFILADFVEALVAVMRIGLLAEARQHHPEWANVYNVLEIWLTTHDAGGVSHRDVNLATEINFVIAPPGQKAAGMGDIILSGPDHVGCSDRPGSPDKSE